MTTRFNYTIVKHKHVVDKKSVFFLYLQFIDVQQMLMTETAGLCRIIAVA